LPVVVGPVVVGPLVVETLPPLPVTVLLPAVVDVPAEVVVAPLPLDPPPPSFLVGDESSPRSPHAARTVRATAPTITPERIRLIVSIPTSDRTARFLQRNLRS
jgi:hypothetical protein